MRASATATVIGMAAANLCLGTALAGIATGIHRRFVAPALDAAATA